MRFGRNVGQKTVIGNTLLARRIGQHRWLKEQRPKPIDESGEVPSPLLLGGGPLRWLTESKFGLKHDMKVRART